MRVSEVNVDLDEFVAAGHKLLSGDGIAVAEVPAQIQIEAFRRIVGSLPISRRCSSAVRQDRPCFHRCARVRLLAGGGGEWPGRIARIEGGLDPRIRTVQVVVAVDEPYRRAAPPERPPLVKNMYVEVELTGRPLPAWPSCLPRRSMRTMSMSSTTKTGSLCGLSKSPSGRTGWPSFERAWPAASGW
jgi:multidrug efflux pump subunit AcrA (membrane-fusion protein)